MFIKDVWKPENYVYFQKQNSTKVDSFCLKTMTNSYSNILGNQRGFIYVYSFVLKIYSYLSKL